MNLLKVCIDFRKAIEEIRDEGGFSVKDRMHRFPGGCCDDTSDLLAFYLWEEYNIETRQLIKIYKPDEPELKCNHAVLLLDNNEIIDLTGDQFPGGAEVYIGEENEFYQAMQTGLKAEKVIKMNKYEYYGFMKDAIKKYAKVRTLD